MFEALIITHRIFYTRVITERFQSSALPIISSSFSGGIFATVQRSAVTLKKILSVSVPIAWPWINFFPLPPSKKINNYFSDFNKRKHEIKVVSSTYWFEEKAKGGFEKSCLHIACNFDVMRTTYWELTNSNNKYGTSSFFGLGQT